MVEAGSKKNVVLRMLSVVGGAGLMAWFGIATTAATVSVSGCDTSECDCGNTFECEFKNASGSVLLSTDVCEGSAAEAEQACFDACVDRPECATVEVTPDDCGGTGG